MQRLANFDVTRQFSARWSQLSAQYVFGAFCAAAMIGIRTLVDVWAPTSAPFALIYPTVMLATLYAHWRAGITTLVLTFAWAWYFILPAPSSFAFVDPTDPSRVTLNAFCCLILIVFAEAFRRAARQTLNESSRSASRRLLLLADLEHRTKNNFALVASMLELQKRTIPDHTLHAPIDDAVSRIRTFAEAYSNLDEEQSESSDIRIKPYLDVLLDRLKSAAIPDHITLVREIEPLTLPREHAVAIGLYLNEAIANCVKYAFHNRQQGIIGVYFHVRDGSWRLVIEDDGVGHAQNAGKGLGTRLMTAFAQQAEAEHRAQPQARGCRVELTHAAGEYTWPAPLDQGASQTG